MSETLHIDSLTQSLASIVGEAHVSVGATDRHNYARDMWPRTLLATRDGIAPARTPDIIVWPKSSAEIAQIVGLAREQRVPIVPYGGGSGVCGGVNPIFGGITIDTKRMTRVIEIDETNLVCEAEAGINGERLERELAHRGFTLGHFPSSIYSSTLGGWLAARSAGQMSTLYGKIEDMALTVTGVTGRGETVTAGRYGRSEAGPDWKQLIIGSEGTLMVITSARLRICPAPEARFLRCFEFPHVPAGLEAIRRVMQRGLRPSVVRLYDELDTLIASRRDTSASPPEKQRIGHNITDGALPSLDGGADNEDDGLLDRLRSMLPGTGSSLRNDLLRAALDKPRWLNKLAETLTSTIGRKGCRLIVGVEGSSGRAEIESQLVFRELVAAGGQDLGEQPGQYWLRNRYKVSYGMSKVFEAGLFVDTMEVASTWERLIDLYDSVRRALGQHAFVLAHFSHAYAEGCSIYFTFAGAAATRKAAERKYDQLWHDGIEAASRAGGTISHHHGVGLLKAPYMIKEHREAMNIFHALKHSLDPDGILNPGKMGLVAPKTPWTKIIRN